MKLTSPPKKNRQLLIEGGQMLGEVETLERKIQNSRLRAREISKLLDEDLPEDERTSLEEEHQQIIPIILSLLDEVMLAKHNVRQIQKLLHDNNKKQ